ncbi:MAG: hypothetical protein IT280_09420 [Ignavibacteria bacterium]|nr:hypothetical protein [Ignavibacteria bacterium]
MAKSSKKQFKVQKSAKIILNPEFNLKINNSLWYGIMVVLMILSAIIPYYFIQYAFSINHYYSFPLDDPWIHLQFAKNLAEYGSFSYFKNEVVTSGSTSPLYTFILAAGFFFTKNEMWLSYITGILFFAVSVYFYFKLTHDVFAKENWLAIMASLLFVLEKWLNFISVTGMETTLYILLLVACYYYYRKMNAVLFAVTLGLTLWTRPDAIAFIIALAVDYIFRMYIIMRAPKENSGIRLFANKELIKIGIIFGAIILIYFAMNYFISGSLLPNTYGAKVKYYSAEFRSRADFLKVDVWEYFTESAYILIFIPFVFAVYKLLFDSVRLKYNSLLMPLIFIGGFIFMYWYQLPYAHRFGRYMMPLFPFYILLSVYGGREFFKWLGRYLNDTKLINGLNIILLASAIIYFAVVLNENKELYQDQSRHIYIRQVETAKWLKNNTPQGSIVATHDVGAIAFYSERKVIDVVGLINPEFIQKLNTKDFVGFVEEQIKKQNVNYLAFLKEWFQVVNQNPLFTAGENNFEIMNVYKYEPGKTHILSSEVNGGIEYVSKLLNTKQFKQAEGVLKQLIAMDPNSSLTYYLMAYSYSALGDQKSSEGNLKKALEIFPDYHDAAISLAVLYKTLNNRVEAQKTLETYISRNPGDSIAIKKLNEIRLSFPKDSSENQK